MGRAIKGTLDQLIRTTNERVARDRWRSEVISAFKDRLHSAATDSASEGDQFSSAAITRMQELLDTASDAVSQDVRWASAGEPQFMECGV